MIADIAPSELFSEQAVSSTLAELHGYHESLAGFVDNLFEEFERSQARLAEREEQVSYDRSALLGDQYAAGQAEISTNTTGELAVQRDELLRELEQARGQISQLAGSATDLATARAELIALKDQLAAATAAPEGLQKHVCDMELERRILEGELDQVRMRSAELLQQLAHEKQEFADRESQWSHELAQLRHALERQADLLAELQKAGVLRRLAEAGSAAADCNEEEPSAIRGDSVVNSLMSQFESLQKDCIRRRAHPKP